MLPSYLDLVYDGSFIGRNSKFNFEYWRLGEEIFIFDLDIDAVLPIDGALLFN